ncbi:MAG: amidohydrolase family protein [Planctomycetes bacterium]|nr:amidohydrolase family protein [Planctomycetota bacterium]
MSSADSAEWLLRARWVVSMGRPPLEDGWVRVRRGRVVDLGAARDRPAPRTAVVFDSGDAVVMPGLVNAHTHLEFSDAVAPLAAAGGLADWIGRVIDLRRSRAAAPDAVHHRTAAIRSGLFESAAHGVTAIGEISTGLPAGGYPAHGPRLRVFREALGLSVEAAEASVSNAFRDVDGLQAAGLAAGISPHAPYSVAARPGRRLVAESRRRSLPLAMHLAESDTEDELLQSGSGPFRDLFERLGVWPAARSPALLPAAEWISLLARGPRGIVVHGTHLGRDADALARLVRHRDRLCVAVCPRTTRAISGTLPPVRLFREAGLRVAIGTDSRASNPDLSVLAECRALVDAGLATPQESLQMATRHGAWALGFERVSGMLAPGRAADLAIVRPSARHRTAWDAILDPGSHLVATLRRGRVIAGRLPGSASC